ncbi:MAG: AMP-binding protein [Burkholderiales bacterium]|nr:AMP-binding protein [Burkholderiales bacterium]OJW86020.1 MAG: hypothetical protein BGO71_11915 [Burkholderiales bacterium 67-32]
MKSSDHSFGPASGHASIGDRSVALRELWSRGARLAQALREGGVREGDALAMLMRNDLCFLEAMIAASLLGAYAVPINWHQKADEVGFILADAAAPVLLAHADLLVDLGATIPHGVRVIASPTPSEIQQAYGLDAARGIVARGVESLEQVIAAHEELADRSAAGTRGSIIYTSGTTGRPKGVRRAALEPEAARRFAALSQQWFDLRPGVRTVMAGPMYHSAPNTYARSVLHSGGSIALMPRFDAEGLLALIERERITHLHLVPTMFVRLLRLPEAVKSRYDLSSLEFVIHGAAPCAREVKQAMIDWWGPVIHEYYGATETGMASRSSSEEWLARPGTLGQAWPGRELRVYGENGERLAAGQIGEIYVGLQGVPNFTYLNADAQRAQVDREGLVTNGDVGYLDEDGYLFLVDRKKDMVISGGVNIYPAEIECALAEHESVADSAVIGVPDAEYGERLVAFVLPSDGLILSEDVLRGFLKSKLANFKVPREFVFVDQLPRDDSGKLMKRKLRDPYWAGRAAAI